MNTRSTAAGSSRTRSSKPVQPTKVTSCPSASHHTPTTCGMMLARLACMMRAYSARVGPRVTRSTMPTRSLRTHQRTTGDRAPPGEGPVMPCKLQWREVYRATRSTMGVAICNRWAISLDLRARRLHLHPDAAPPSLTEPRHAQRAAGDVAQQDGRPNVGGTQALGRLEQGAEAQREDDPGHDRDAERRARVARALQSPRVGERDGDEQPPPTA